jgi:hypothetical protein
VPAVAADLTTKDTWVEQIVVANKTGAAATFTVVDKAGTPKTLVPTVSLPANSLTVMSFPKPVKMTGGVNWVAGTADALEAEVKGYRVAG